MPVPATTVTQLKVGAAGGSSRPPQRLSTARKGIGSARFALLAVALGIVAGCGAFGFRALIAFFHNLLFLGRFSFFYDANAHTPAAPWGLAVVLVPSLAALAVVFLVKKFAPEAKGHGVPEVIDAIYYQKGVIRPVVAVVKSFASAISIGSGGSVGREGPIIQIGAAFASSVGRYAGASRWQLVTLVAAGGGAGIAATFNTPIGGVLFAVEVLMHEVSVRTLVPVALATATATYVGQFLLGSHPAFEVPALTAPAAAQVTLLPLYVLLGCILAPVSVLFIRGLYGAEDGFEKWIPGRPYLRHFAGMLGVGIVAVALMHFAGHYYVQGVGYATILDVLSGAISSVPFLLCLFALKLLVTCLTLGSGASGGVFSPSLFMGATIGGAFGLAVHALIPQLDIDPAAFALAGMAGVVAGATGAALTSIVMIFEMTRDYSVVLPMTLTVALAYGLRRALWADSIYTMKLTRRGHYAPQALQANAGLVHHVSDMVLERAVVLGPDAPASQIVFGSDPDAPSCFVLVGPGDVKGIIPRDWSFEHLDAIRAARLAADVARSDFVTVSAEDTVAEVLIQMAAAGARLAVVVGEPSTGPPETPEILGVITKAHMAEVLAEGMELFGD